MEKLNVPREDWRKGSRKKIQWSTDDVVAFEELKDALCDGLQLVLQHLNPDRPFILRTDASDQAIRAVLEQLVVLVPGDRLTMEQVQKKVKTVPVAFLSRKLTSRQSFR